MSYEGVSDLSLPPLITALVKTMDALGGDIVLDDVIFALASIRENHGSETPVVKATCGFEYNMIMVSKGGVSTGGDFFGGALC